MAIGREMKRTFRRDKKTDNEWSDRSKSMRSAGGTSNTREVRSAIKNTARSFATPMRTPSVARSGYLKKAYSNRTLQTPQSGYTQKIASKAYLNTARNGGEEGKENAQNRTGRIAKSNTYTSFVKSRTGKSPRLSGKGKRIISANKALLDRYNRGK